MIKGIGTLPRIGRAPWAVLLAAACACGSAPASFERDERAAINEVDCQGRDWVEIVNTSGAELAVGGWALSDDPTKADHRYLLPVGIVLGVGERLVVRQQKNTQPGFPFGLGCDQDTVTLLDPAGKVVDQVRIGVIPVGTTWGRYPDLSDTWQETSPTAGSVNQLPPSAAAVLFDPRVVHTVAVVLPPASVESLTASPYVWAEGTVTVTAGGVVAGPLSTGVRLKSGASFRPLGKKASFKLDFDRYQDGQRMLGLKALVLNGMVHDPTAMHETLAYAVFRAAGVPAARTGYARLSVNGQDYGLYLVVETYDDVFANAQFDSTGHVYEGLRDILPGFLDKAVDVDEGDPDDRRDLDALAATVHDTGDATWASAVSQGLDLGLFLRHWAAENWVGQLDGYALVANNYFLHSNEQGFFTILPWGLDWAFVAAQQAPACAHSVLCVRCLGIPACAAGFDEALVAVDQAAKGLALDAEVTALDAIVGPALATDPLAEFDEAARVAGMQTLRDFLARRSTSPSGAFPVP